MIVLYKATCLRLKYIINNRLFLDKMYLRTSAESINYKLQYMQLCMRYDAKKPTENPHKTFGAA